MTSINSESRATIFSSVSLPSIAPSKGEALVCVGNLDVFEDVSISSAENSRARGISSAEARARFLAGRRLLRGVLSGWTNSHPEDIHIVINDRGKPFLANGFSNHFSISHSCDFVALAFACTPIGIDLEKERTIDAFAITERFFPQDGRVLLGSQTNEYNFIKLWTYREAAIKADGRGLARLLPSTRIKTLSDSSALVEVEQHVWSAFSFTLKDGYHGSVALNVTPKVIHWCDLR